MQASLNKGEVSNNLRKAVFFNRLGQIRDRAYESQLHRVRGLNLLVAAIVLWNSRYLVEAVTALPARFCQPNLLAKNGNVVYGGCGQEPKVDSLGHSSPALY